MNPQWNTPPNGDFVAYVERLTAQAALRSAAQQARNGRPAQHGSSEEAELTQPADEPAAARARALFGAPGEQLSSEHPLARLALKLREKLESSLQEAAMKKK